MSVLAFRRPGNGRSLSAPLWSAHVDQSHPFASGLVACAVPNDAGGMFDVKQGVPLITYGSPTRTPNRNGSSFTTASSGHGWKYPTTNWLPLEKITILLLYKKDDDTLRQNAAFGVTNPTQEQYRCGTHINWNSPTSTYWDFGGVAAGGRISVSNDSGYNAREWNTWVFQSLGNVSPLYIWVNGKIIAYSSTDGKVRQQGDDFWIANGQGTIAPDNGTWGGLLVWDRVLTEYDVVNVSADPFQMLRW